MPQQISNGEGHAVLLRKLHPIFELTAVVRPRLLLAASSPEVGPILLGLLYHKEKDAFQSRLRFRVSPTQEFLRRTRWRRFVGRQTFARRQEQVSQGFSSMVAKIGGGGIIRIEFAARASDAVILESLLSSAVPSLLGE